MSPFTTSGARQLALELGAASVSILARDGADTVVEVGPADPDRPADVQAAQQTTVERVGDRVVVTARQGWRALAPWSSGGTVTVRVEAPPGIDLEGRVGAGVVACAGRLGECRVVTGAGDLDVAEAATVRLRTGAGTVTVGRLTGRGDIATGTGTVDIGELDGQVVVKNANGRTRVGTVRGDVRVQAANGAVSFDRVDGSAVVRTANGDVRADGIGSGSVTVDTGCGAVDVGLREGPAAWLDLQSRFGAVRNDLAESAPPADGAASVSVRVRTGMGDIRVRRSAGEDADSEKLSDPADRLPL